MDRLIDREAERLDVSVMAIDAVVLVGVAVTGRSVFVIVELGIGLRPEPVLYVEVLGLWVVKAGIEQRCRIYDAVFCNDLELPPSSWSTLRLWKEEDRRWQGSVTSLRRS